MTLPARVTFLNLDLAVVQQPADQPAWVSSRAGEVTHFAAAARYGCLGLIAHNTLAGSIFDDLKAGDVITVSYPERVERYAVTDLQSYEAERPYSPYSSFIDAETGETIAYNVVFEQMYMVTGRLVLQTCIEKFGLQTWGRLFVVAERMLEMKLFLPTKVPFLLTQSWGENPQNYSGYGLQGHNGIDWGTPVGTPIYAAHDGKVITAQYDGNGYGRYVELEALEGWGKTIYAHASRLDVKVGDVVPAKTQLMLSGGAVTDPYRGYSTGPHLHFGFKQYPINYSNGFQGAVDPAPYLADWEDDMADELPVLWRGKVMITALRIRGGPSTSTTHIGWLYKGNEIEVIEVSADGWLRMRGTLTRWCYGGGGYVSRIPEPEKVALEPYLRALDGWARKQGYDGPILKSE